MVTVLHYGRVIADGPRERVKADPQVKEIYLGA
jgi:ABC-type branched-subunit amino acid transport system ATPase component